MDNCTDNRQSDFCAQKSLRLLLCPFCQVYIIDNKMLLSRGGVLFMVGHRWGETCEL